jgi:hypothetical protein
MKHLSKILLFVFTCLCTALNAQQPERYFRFVEPNREKINTLVTRIISIDRVKADTVWAYANNEEFARFSELGYKVELLTPPSLLPGKVVNMATTIGQMASWNRYPTYLVYREMVKKFEQDYPQLCKLDSIGTTVEGRKLYVLKISNNVQANEAEPEVLYSSTIHGDEVTGFVLMLRLADYLLSQYGSNPRITNLLNGTAIYINPDANPDGTYNSGNSTVSGAQRYNQNNVDLNRNFPDPRAGDHPDGYSWQPETQAMMNFANEHHFVLSANFHGGSEVANYPWDTWTSAQRTHADNSWFYTISRAYADTVHAHSPTGYFVDENNGVTNGGDWYVITGGRQDYMNYWHHCREITMEISSTKLLSSDELPAYWSYNQESLIGYLEHALTGFYGTVTNPDGEPLNATITIPSHDRDNSHVATNPEFGNYYRMIAPGNYEVLFQSDGYISQIQTVSVPSYSSRIMKDVVLEPAQQVNLSGLATDSLTGNPIEGAKVELTGSSYQPVYTNAQGMYTFSAIYEGYYQVRVSKVGYIASTREINLTSSNNTLNFSLIPSAAESFELHVPSVLTFTGGSWSRTNQTAYTGSYSLRSASITNNSRSTMSLTQTFNGSGEVAFARKVSSEEGYDFLKFYIDGAKKGEWSGEQSWGEESYSITPGTHTLKWEYIKDGSTTGGSDCAWIDDIILSPTLQNATFTVLVNGTGYEGLTVNFDGKTANTGNDATVNFYNVSTGMAKPVSVLFTGNTLADTMVNVVWASPNSYSMNIRALFDVTFWVISEGSPVEGATVSLNALQQQTNAQGYVTFTDIPFAPNSHVDISRSGYNSYEDDISVASDSTYTISLNPNASEPIVSNTQSLRIFPNPFTDRVNIEIETSEYAQVQLEVYSILGCRVDNIFNGMLTPGIHNFMWKYGDMPKTQSSGNVFMIWVRVNDTIIVRKIVQIQQK